MATDPYVEREFLLSFWKLHILHHADEEPIVGQWVLRELQRHGYQISPGTLYPLLARMTERGWLACRSDPDGGPRAPRFYTLTRRGRSVLALLRRQIEELYREIVLGEEDHHEHEHPTAARRRPRSRPARRRDER